MLLFSALLLTSRRARHERTLLTSGSFLAHVRSAAAGHAADGGFGHHYGTFVNAADNFRVDSVGDTYLHRMGGKGVAFAGPEFMFPFAILHDIIVADKRFFGVEAQGTGRSAQYVFAVEGEDGDVGCQAWFQFQVRVVGEMTTS